MVDPNGFQGKEWLFPSIGQPMDLDLEVMRARLLGGAEPEIENAGAAVPQVSLPEGESQSHCLNGLSASFTSF